MKKSTLYAVIGLLAIGFFMPAARVFAYDPSQIAGQVADVLQQSGAKEACIAGNVLDRLGEVLDNLGGSLTNAIGQLLSTFAKAIMKTLAICGAKSIPVIGQFIPFSCNLQMASDTMEAQIEQMKQNLKQDFIGRCVAAAEMYDIYTTVDAILNDQGPNGGTVAVTNWIDNLYTEPDRQAMRRMWAILVNTDICPYFRNAALDYFGVPQSYRDNPPSIASTDLNTSADAPFQLRGACTLPSDYIPGSERSAEEFAANGGYSMLTEISKSQNNLQGFIDIAEAELARQRSVSVQAAINEAVSGGGFRSVYGPGAESCEVMDSGGKCIKPARVKNPPAAAEQLSNTKFEGPLLWLAGQNGTDKKAMQDMSAIFANGALDMVNAPLPFNIEFGLEDNPDLYTPKPTPIPSPGQFPVPSECTDLQGDQDMQAAITAGLSQSMAQLMQQHPDLFSPPGSSVLAQGVSSRQVAQALCDVLNASAAGACEPHPTIDTQIVLNGGGLTISVDIITSDGALRTNGGIVIASCPEGIQN